MTIRNRILPFLPLAWQALDKQRRQDRARRLARIRAIELVLASVRCDEDESEYDGWLPDADQWHGEA